MQHLPAYLMPSTYINSEFCAMFQIQNTDTMLTMENFNFLLQWVEELSPDVLLDPKRRPRGYRYDTIFNVHLEKTKIHLAFSDSC